jgi:hypothetical protein
MNEMFLLLLPKYVKKRKNLENYFALSISVRYLSVSISNFARKQDDMFLLEINITFFEKWNIGRYLSFHGHAEITNSRNMIAKACRALYRSG